MAWNRPSGNDEHKSGGNARRGKCRPLLRGAIAGVVIVAGAIVAYLAFVDTAGTSRRSASSAGPKRIKEVNPAAVKSSPAESRTDRAAGTNRVLVTTKTYVDEQGVERYPGGARVPNKRAKRVTMPDRRAVKWKYDCEDTICTFIQMEPGDIIVGDDVEYGESFVRDFKSSLKEEIRIEPDDDWYQRQLKEDVIAAKKDLVEAMNRGEDIAKVMTETRREMRRLFEYRQELLSQVSTLMHKEDSGYTEKDLDDLVGAANKMLEDKGCQPIKVSRMMMRKILRKNQNSKKEERK